MPSNSATALRVFHTATPLLVFFLIGAAHSSSGWAGTAALCLGLAGTAVFLYGTWVVVRLAGTTAAAGSPTRNQVVTLVLALLLKLPLIYAGWALSQGLGPFGPAWFLAGLGLVYSLVVWRAVLAVRA